MKKQKRPIIITIICIIGFIGASIGIFTPLINYFPQEVLNQFDFNFSTWYLFVTSIISIGLLYSFILIWKMKKMGVYGYIGITIISYILAQTQGMASLTNLIFPIIFIAIFFIYIKKMK